MQNLNLASLASLVWIIVGCSGGSSFTSPGGATGGQAGNGGSGTGGDTGEPPASGGGPATMSCEQLAAAYSAELLLAKQCAATSATADRCTTKVKATIACGCETFVNPARTGAIANLTKYSDAYDTQGCSAVCPAIACQEPTSASCTSSGSGGGMRCSDINAASTN